MSQQSTCDIAVVGAGPAGATAAYLLARAGLDILLIDRQQFPRPKLCAGLLTWKTVRLIEEIFDVSVTQLKSMGLIRHCCSDYKIFFNRSPIAAGRLSYPFHLVDRSIYDHHWLLTAQRAGARIETGIAVKQIVPHAKTVLLADGRMVSAKVIIGADGVWSKVRRAMHHQKESQLKWRRGLAATIETFQHDVAATTDSNFAMLHFGAVPWGYGWSFPREGLRILGIARLPSKQGPSIKQGFTDFLSALAIDSRQLNKLKGHPLPYGNYQTQPAKGDLLLVGDACGLADPLLGEGIYYAHRSAQIAARAIIACKGKWHECAPVYSDTLNRLVVRELRWVQGFRNILFIGGMGRKYRGLKLFFRLFPKRLEAAVHGRISFSRLLVPGFKKITY